MKRFIVRRRLQNGAITLLVVGFIAWHVQKERLALRTTSFLTGWLLLGALVFLSLYNVRKRIASPPLGSSSSWLQAHIYVALGMLPVAAMHAPWRLPNGILETALAALFALAWTSGLLGLYWTRTLPRRMSRVGEEIIYERASLLRSQLRDRAQATILGMVRTSGDWVLGDYFRQKLHAYFETEPTWRKRCFPSPRLRKSLLAELTEATRYFSDGERRAAEEIFSLVRRRDAIDYQEALQWRLRVWLVVHVALTWPLLLTASVHAWLAHLFAGSSL